MLREYYADMHIHIGRDKYNNSVKITASQQLTMTNILKEASRRKGIQLIGIIDSHSPGVQDELADLINVGVAHELEHGGVQFEQTTVLLGAEIEIYDDNCHGPVHVLIFLPTLAKMRIFTNWLKTKVTNITLSSQRYYGTAKDLQTKVKKLKGLFIPAHVFTPHKSLYGKGVKNSLTEIFHPELIDAIELGLSSDTWMADHIAELHDYPFLSNSDAHSLAKIAREYQVIYMKEPSFKEFTLALQNKRGRKIVKNYGMNPKLGKYYSTVCKNCYENVAYLSDQCSNCQSTKIVNGVYDRIMELATPSPTTPNRPPYRYQVPLEYFPKLGPKTMERLLDRFNTEMNIVHHVPKEQLEEILSTKLTHMILSMRKGSLPIEAGGGGKYGRIDLK